ncbi:MAG: hypothetical protein Q7U76_12880 [Nitrospirota bacterium]|nr:hypothetical protein [Nitrospirota bacterium]
MRTFSKLMGAVILVALISLLSISDRDPLFGSVSALAQEVAPGAASGPDSITSVPPVVAEPSTVAAVIDIVDPAKQSFADRLIAGLLGVFPVALSFFGSYITQAIQALMGKLSAPVAASISTFMGGLLAIIVAALFPGLLPPDVAAALGAGGGASGHLLTQKAPLATTVSRS